ncbi:MAG: transcriptional repressor, partial [Verrucomicrobiota bacterium]
MQEQSTRDAVREVAFAYWRDKGRGITVVRKLIWQAIETARGAFNADELLAMVREQDKAVSPSTVYRNLKDLIDANVLQELQGPDDRKVYVVANGEMTA